MNSQVADKKKRIIWAVNPFDEERYRCGALLASDTVYSPSGTDRAQRLGSDRFRGLIDHRRDGATQAAAPGREKEQPLTKRTPCLPWRR